MPAPGFVFGVDGDPHQEVLAAYNFNVTWYAHAARVQRALHFTFGIGIILGQVATLSSFAFEGLLPSRTSPVLAGITSALIAIFGFLSPTAKWRVFRSAQFELSAQSVLYRLDFRLAKDAVEQRDVIAKYIELGMRVVSSAATSYWRQVTKSAEQLKTGSSPDSPHGSDRDRGG